MPNRRSWGADEWQAFALKLVQLRHQAQNVQIVPDKVSGDAGIEFFTTDGCIYQCYAPEETSDVKKAASAMKDKARRDLPKLIEYQNVIGGLLSGIRAERWILLCPFLDNKDVVADIRNRAQLVRDAHLPFVSEDFEALVQSQDDFICELERLRAMSAGPPLVVEHPTPEAVDAANDGVIGTRLLTKLHRAFGQTVPTDEIRRKRREYVRAHLHRENTLDAMRRDHPALWERSLKCIAAEECRLVAIGATSEIPGEQLSNSIDRIEKSLHGDLPTLERATVTEIAVGTVSDWLVRCPLDFPETKKTT